MFKKIINFLFILMNICVSAQTLPAFTVNATKVNDETCASNGAISWATSNTDPGSVITYKVVNTANNSTVAALSGNTYTSLVAGTYKIEATQVSGTLSNKATSNTITIANSIKTLAYTLTVDSNEICGNDGQVTVNVTSGNGPYQYQIIDPSTGSVLLSQSSNVFTNLTAGTKTIRVIDGCATASVQSVTLKNTPSNINRINFPDKILKNCSIATYKNIQLFYSNGETFKAPFTMEVSFTNPNTALPENIIKTVTLNDQQNLYTNFATYTVNLDLPYSTTINALNTQIKITDACGKVYNFNYSFDYSFQASYGQFSATCGSKYFYFYYPYPNSIPSKFKVNLISGPAGFNPADYDTSNGVYEFSHRWGSSTQPLPAGEYNMVIENECGQKISVSNTIYVSPPSFSYPRIPSCTTGLGGINATINGGFILKSARIISGPAEYTGTLPHDLTIRGSGEYNSFYFTNVPPGTYTYEYTVTCDTTVRTATFTVDPTDNNSSVIPVVSCGRVDLAYNSSLGANYTNVRNLGLQRYYPEYGAWSFVTTYLPQTSADPNPYTFVAYSYGNQTVNTSVNDLSSGRYRSVILYDTYDDNGNKFSCFTPYSEFEISSLELTNAYAFKCIDGTYNVAVVASKVSVATLKYAIMSDGSPTATVVRDNGTNPIFNGLQNGSYYFRVTDDCGNFKVRKLDIAALGKPGIRTVFDCSTTPGSVKLVVDGLENLSYEWTKEGSTTVLSTTNILDLGTYDASKAGKYFVNITSSLASYCINETLEISLSADALANPRSGTAVLPQPTPVSYDGSVFTVDLFKYLQPDTYDGFGTWTEISTPASNTLDGNNWNIYAAKEGLYTFRYTVKSPCGTAVNYTDVSIKLSKFCYKSPINTGTIEDTKVGMTSLGRAGKDRDNWPMLRKGGWIALESNTKGFVVNRIGFNSNNEPIGIPTSNFVEGMMVYDTTNNCLKIYNGTAWSCFTNPACPD